MECPVCGQAAPRGANFCFACGTSLARACPRCRAGQSPDARFCPECGTTLPPGPGATDEAPVAAPPVAEALLDDAALEAAIERARRRESWRRLATVAGVLLLILALLGGVAFWSRTRPPRPERAAEPARPATPPPPAAPAPASSPVASPPAAPDSPPSLAGSPPAPPGPAITSVPAAPPPTLPERDAPDRAPRAVPLPEPPLGRRPPDATEAPAAMPDRARADVRVEVAAMRVGEGITAYTISLRERDGAPVTQAAVTIRGRRADGALVEALLDPTPEPGVYRAVLRMGEVIEPRLRVTSAGRIQDLPLSE
jgi:hypothetical protein